MHPDILSLREFYQRPIGQVARRMIARALRTMWPALPGRAVLGIGYATPYLRPYLGEAERVVALMPAPLGVAAWPPGARNLAVLAEESDFPLPDGCFDAALIVHGLETSEAVRPLLRQVWRVLRPGGRLIAVVPNRTSLWAQIETTPFGHGHPFTREQLARLLREAMLEPQSWARTLWAPPFGGRRIVRTGETWEAAGRRIAPQLSGLILVEAEKSFVQPVRARARRVRIAPALKPQPAFSAPATAEAPPTAP